MGRPQRRRGDGGGGSEKVNVRQDASGAPIYSTSKSPVTTSSPLTAFFLLTLSSSSLIHAINAQVDPRLYHSHAYTHTHTGVAQ